MKDMKNPISGHEWSEPTGLAPNCGIQGPGAIRSTKYRSVKGAVDHVEFLQKYPFNYEPTERDYAYREQMDESVNRAERRRQAMR